MPDGGHAADNGGTHQHQHQRPQRRVKHAHHPLVARKQPRHTLRGGRVDRKQRARHMDHAAQHAIAGHVDAVVVARAQVERGKQAVVKLPRQPGVTPHQRSAAVVVALGLKNLLPLNAAKLADGPIHRANQRCIGQRPHTRLERAGKKLIESGVARGVGLRGLGQVDLVAPCKPGNQRSGGRCALPACHAPGQLGQCLLGQQVLRQHGQTFKHGQHDP